MTPGGLDGSCNKLPMNAVPMDSLRWVDLVKNYQLIHIVTVLSFQEDDSFCDSGRSTIHVAPQGLNRIAGPFPGGTYGCITGNV